MARERGGEKWKEDRETGITGDTHLKRLDLVVMRLWKHILRRVRGRQLEVVQVPEC